MTREDENPPVQVDAAAAALEQALFQAFDEPASRIVPLREQNETPIAPDMGGVFAADADRFDAPIRAGLPYVASVGAMDMVNFGPRENDPLAACRTQLSINCDFRHPITY